MRFQLVPCLALLALAACDRISSPTVRDAGVDSLATLWETVDAGAVNYNAVAGSAPDNVFIVGDQGTILHWDGISLLPELSGTTANLRGVSVADSTVAYAVGELGTILSRQNGVWTPAPSPTMAVLNAVLAWNTIAIAVGEQGTILNLRHGVWELVPNTRTENYYGLADSNNGVWIAGAMGVLVHIDYGTSTIDTTASIAGYTKVLGGGTRYSSGALFVGVDGGFFYWNNGSATRIDGLPQKFLRAISLVEGTAWVVGHEGLVARKPDNEPAIIVPTPDDRWLLGVYAAAARDVWVVGRSGLIMRGPPGERNDGGPPP
jgi:hypothetical protein